MVISCSRRCIGGIVTLFTLLAMPAQAVVYKWVEDDDRVVYSNDPPPDPGKVRELTRIDDMALVPGERRPELVSVEKPAREAIVSEPERQRSPKAAPAKPGSFLYGEVVTLLPKDPQAAARDTESAPRVEPPPRVIPRSTHTSAVQDPCLVSPDPQCYERNKANYHPFAGYVPPGAAAPQAVGATASAAGGAVGGQAPAARSSAPPPPKNGAYALPPGSAPSISIEWARR